MEITAGTDGASGGATSSAPGDPARVGTWSGDRAPLRPLFELAEDSAAQLDTYLDNGIVLVAYIGDETVGHLQLVDRFSYDADVLEETEIKNMAVTAGHQGCGIGRLLVAEAVRRARTDGKRRILVATAAADVGNLRFYQRQGFRMLSIERDAFVPGTGYPDPVDIDGIPLRDRVWLDRDTHMEWAS